MSTTVTDTSAGGWTPRLAFSACVMILILEATSLGFLLVSVALPQVSQHFQTTQGGWLITAYVLSGAVLSPLMGKLADILGKRKVMVICLSVSLVGAIITTAAPTFGVLILGRFLQGATIPTMFLSYSLMRDVYPTRILALATSMSMTGIGVFSIGTPFLVGALLDTWGFRALFAFDIAWLAVLIPLLVVTTPESPVRHRSKVDVLGAASLGLGLCIVLAAISLGNTWGWTSAATLGGIALGLVLLVCFVVRSLRYSAPIVNLRIFTTRAILLAVVTAAAAQSMSGNFWAMSPIIAQTPREVGGDYGLGLTALEFGWLSAPQALLIVLAGIMVGKLTNKVGAALLMNVGLVMMMIGGVLIGFSSDTFGGLLTACAVTGIGCGLCWGTLPALVISGTTPENQATIAGMVQVSYSSFSAITPVVLFIILGSYATIASDGFVVYSAEAFQWGGILMAGVLAVALLLALTVLRGRRQDSMIVDRDRLAEQIVPADVPVPGR
ncbi:MFS transporter [Pseudonocardia aurantiaca]|uniref:MFS transporter n=1 Tax=Pseudonocardia aurantiaca TaxID=75290 RepID=A0ABW4FQ37_9PSEU